MHKFVKLFAISALSMAPISAFAADLPPLVRDEVMQACRPDYHRVCGEVLPGDGRVGRCLKDHEEELSPACLKAVKFAYAIEVCKDDYQRYCQGVEPGGGRIVQCLSEQSYNLAPACERVVSANAPYVTDRKYSDSYGYSRDRGAYDRYAYSHRPPYDGYRAEPRYPDTYDRHRDERYDEAEPHDEDDRLK
jgi:hypothetical protein